MINTLIISKKRGIIFLIAAVIGFTLAGILHSSEVITIKFNLNAYSSTLNSWISYMLGFSFILIVTIITIGIYNDFFVNNIEALKNKISAYESAQKELNKAQEVLRTQNEELKKLNSEITIAKERAEEGNRLKASFLHNLSHEIRTPLNAINGFSMMLNNPAISDEKRKNFVSIILTSSKKLLSFINDILTISSLETRIEKVHIGETLINKIVTDLFESFKSDAENKKIIFKCFVDLDDEASVILSDKNKIIQILSNLLNNAITFTHQGSIQFGYRLKADDLEFYVEDTGEGIKPELLEAIFDSFRQSDLSLSKVNGGAGLGLSISKGFVELLGGKMWVKSEYKKGSVFYFTIPYEPVNK